MSSSWPKAWDSCATSSAGMLEMAAVCSKSKQSSRRVARFFNAVGEQSELVSRRQLHDGLGICRVRNATQGKAAFDREFSSREVTGRPCLISGGGRARWHRGRMTMDSYRSSRSFQPITATNDGFEFVVGEKGGKRTLTIRDGEHENVLTVAG